MVGQNPTKKRKRTKGEGAAANEKDDVEPFDYSTVSNILDEGSEHEEGAVGDTRKRRQKAHGKHAL